MSRKSTGYFARTYLDFVPVKFARDFRAIVSPPFIKRFVFRSDSSSAKRYVRFLKDGGPQDLSQVNYVPQAAFNL